MKHNITISEEFKIPVWSLKQVREYLNEQKEIKELHTTIKSFNIEEECYIIFYYLTVSITGKRKSIRKFFGEIKKGIKRITDGEDNTRV
jgi:hypothetical protein